MKKILSKLALVLLAAGLAMPAAAWDDDAGWGDDSGWDDSGSDGWGDSSGSDNWGSGGDSWGGSSSSPAPRYMTDPTSRGEIVSGVVDNHASGDKWQNSMKSVFWEDYRGNNVRIELLRSNSDMKEMRLKFVQSSNLYSNPDGTVSEMLSRVAARTMKRVCGKNARSAMVLYERPGQEFTRMTAADPYVAMASGSLKEYGFRCIY